MTGLFGRLRAWLSGGSETETSDDATDADAEATTEQSSPQVVHRDDRPLETPQTLERPNPPASTPDSDESAGDGPVPRTPESIADAEAGAEEEPTPDRVSIPDAESAAGGATGGGAVDDESADAESTDDDPTDEATTPAEPTADDSAGESTTDESAPDDGDATFACSVCGTTVDDPDSPCPLCRSTDVVPVGDAPTEGETPSRGGRTAVSTGTDEEAVDQLRDVRGADE